LDRPFEKIVVQGLRAREIGRLEVGGDESPWMGVCGHRNILYS